MKEKLTKIITTIILFSLIFTFGWVSNELYKDITNKRIMNGLWIRNADEAIAKNIAKDMDSLGDWVCVNTRGMTFKEAIKTCNHEVGHEIWAEFCEDGDNVDKCIEVVEEEW